MLKFSQYNEHCAWSDDIGHAIDGHTPVKDAIEARMAKYVQGTRPISDFEFSIRDSMPVLRLGPHTMTFSRLSWARFSDMYGFSRKMVRKMMEGGALGENYLISLINDLMQGKAGGPTEVSREMMLVEEKENEFTIREMLRDMDSQPPSEKEFFELALSVASKRDPTFHLHSYRLSDHGTTFRFFAEEGDIGFDINFSLGFKAIHSKAVIMLHGEIAAMPFGETTWNPDDVDRCVGIVLGKAGEHYTDRVPREGFESMEVAMRLVSRYCKERKVLAALRREILKDMVRMEHVTGPTDMVGMSEIIASAKDYTTRPDQFGRMEKVLYDLHYAPEEWKATDEKEVAELLTPPSSEIYAAEEPAARELSRPG